jgi:ATP-dependent Lon protease
VLPIGGVREKILAAHRAGMKTVILPEKNKKDLVEVPKKVLEDLNIILVRHMDDVLPVALHSEQVLENRTLKKIRELIAKDREEERKETEKKH